MGLGRVNTPPKALAGGTAGPLLILRASRVVRVEKLVRLVGVGFLEVLFVQLHNGRVFMRLAHRLGTSTLITRMTSPLHAY